MERLYKWLAERSNTPPTDKRKISWSDIYRRAEQGFLAQSRTGINVTEETALSSSAVYSAVKLLSNIVGTIPLITYKRLPDGGKERFTQHPLYQKLHVEPYPFLTRQTFFVALTTNLLLWNNTYAEIVRNGNGDVMYLAPVYAEWVKGADRVAKADGTETIEYRIENKSGTARIPFDDMLHIPTMVLSNIFGEKPVQHLRDNIGIGLAAERTAASYYGNDATPQGHYEYPGRLSDKARDNLDKGLTNRNQGVDNSWRNEILEEGLKYVRTQANPEESQLLETRAFQVKEVARILTMPGHMLGDSDGATHSNVEQQALNFLKYTLQPILVGFELELSRKLFRKENANGEKVFCEFLTDGLLRPDAETRHKVYDMGIKGSFRTPNEARRAENLEPYPGGDVLLFPQNMVAVPIDGSPSYALNQIEPRAEVRKALPSDFTPLYLDVGQRIVAREIIQLRKLLKKDGIDKVADVYAKQAEYMRGVLAPVLTATGTEAKAADVIKAYCDQSLKDLWQTDNAEDLLNQWAETKAQTIATQLQTLGE